MWSDSNRDYVKQLVETMHKEYPYYLAHTCTYWGLSNSQSYPTFKVYFSKEPITVIDLYTYQLPSDSVVYNVRSGNANSNYNDERITIYQAGGRVKIEDYEFIYTNAESETVTVQPDILATTNVTQSHFDGVSLIMLVILLSAVVAKIIKR